MNGPTSGAPPHRSDAAASIDAGVVMNAVAERVPDAPATELGPGARIRSGSVIYRGSTIGPWLETGHGVVIREGNTVGERCAIWNHSTLDYECVVGDRVKLHCNVYVAQFSTIEDDAFIGPNTVFANDLVPGNAISRGAMRGPTIRRGAQIGAGCVVLPFVEIGAGALIGAGSVVTGNVPPGLVAAGNPARLIRRVDDLHERLMTEGVWMPGEAKRAGR